LSFLGENLLSWQPWLPARSADFIRTLQQFGIQNGNQLASSATYSSLDRKILQTVTIPLPGISTLKKF
jgi:hypothetical protein